MRAGGGEVKDLIRGLVKVLRPSRRRSRHSLEDVLDALWASHIHELAEYRRAVWGWM